MNLSKIQLIALAQNNPEELIRIISNPNTEIRAVILGTEILSDHIFDEEVILPVFRQLIKHINALVRENILIGISSFYMDKSPPRDILERIVVISNTDPSQTIKDCAKLLLKDFKFGG